MSELVETACFHVFFLLNDITLIIVYIVLYMILKHLYYYRKDVEWYIIHIGLYQVYLVV